MNLLLDLGNTRLKCALSRDGTFGESAAFAHAEAGFDAHFEAWLAQIDASRLSQAWLAAVAPDAAITRVQAALDRVGIQTHRVATQADTLGLRVAYAQPHKLGVDRWLAMLAARARSNGAVLVASVGSALTVDAVDADGHHLGGLIAPPPEAMRAALLARAPRLDVADGEVHRFARSTEDGIASGCLLAAAALIERSHTELARKIGAKPMLVLSGGGAPPLRPWLPTHQYAPALVLEGLARWAGHAKC